MFFELPPLFFLTLVAIFWLLVEPLLNRQRNGHRALIAVVSVAIGVRYLLWRYLETVRPVSGPPLELFWVWLVYLVEILAFIEACLFLMIMSRTNTRNKEADNYERQLFRHPSVDVFIPTYNEGLDVLEKTIVGAKHLDYPNFKVWVLDDGKRPWLKDYCAKQEVGYLTRPDNAHAKAGNLNNGLKHADGELFAIFDADFIPARNFLRRTVGFFLHHDDIGVVQTPQHFFNKDPIQSNLYLDKVWPDEQRLFFDVMAPCRDSWNAAFCCGSCSIIRRKAIDAVGGIPTSSITEDLLTTLTLLTVNYRTVYLNEKLSQGMSAESITGYFIQRGRWCRGGIQCFFVKEGPLRAKGLTILQRVLFTPYGWIVQPITRLMVVVVPIVYLWFGLAPLHYTNALDIVAYQLPMLAMLLLTMRWLAPQKYVPLVSTAIGVFSMFRLLPVALSSLVKPFGVPFRVTPKGSGSATGIDWYTFAACIGFTALTAGGILANIVPEYQRIKSLEFFPYALLWSSLNVLMLLVCALICFDTPRKRKEERFLVDEPATCCGQEMVIHDLSVGGCKLTHTAGQRVVERGTAVSIPVAGLSAPLPAVVKNSNDHEVICQFVDTPPALRDELIAKLFTGDYDNEIHEVKSIAALVMSLLRRAVGKELN